MRSLIFLILLSPFVFADEIQLNTFQNGEVADADEVNQNFDNLKQVVEQLNQTIKRVSCNALQGVYLNDSCTSPELSSEVELDNPVNNHTFLSFDTSNFEFESSTGMEISIYSDGTGNSPVDCFLVSESSGILFHFDTINNEYGAGQTSADWTIQDRLTHNIVCSTSSALDLEVAVEFY